MTPDPPSLKDHLEALRRSAAQAQRSGTPATEIARTVADSIGALALDLFERERAKLASCPPVALVALGSLGRREMSPYSDLDLTVVTPHPRDPRIQQLVEGVLYPLWDARLDVGHAVRSVREFAELAQEDDTVRTGAVDRRLLGGDPQVWQALDQALRRALAGSRTRRYVKDILERWTDQHSPATVYRLEPNIKTGPGGLRELQRVWWVARLVWRIGEWPDLLTGAFIGKHDYDTLQEGREVMLGIRLALHICTKRRHDQLRFDLQSDVAAQLGLPDEDRSGADRLLERFYRHAKAVRAASVRTLERCAEDLSPAQQAPRADPVDGFCCFRGRLTLATPDQLERRPRDLLGIFRTAQVHGLALHSATRERITACAARLLTAEVIAQPEVGRLLLDILGDPRGGGAPLELMHELGVLERVVPELLPVTGLVQRDTYHTFTVDAHLVACAARAMALTSGLTHAPPASASGLTQPPPASASGLTHPPPPNGPEAPGLGDVPPEIATVAHRLARPHLLVLAALLHDIGKGHGHGHAERGARIARQVAERLQLPRRDAEDLSWLVLEHLTLFRLSQRRDLQDPALIAQLAESVQSRERLDLLLVLSYCDATTTGPAAWSDWKWSLLRELYQRTRQGLEAGAERASLATRAAARLEELEAQLGPRAEALRAFAQKVGPHHLVTYRSELLLRHLEALEQAEAQGAAVTLAPHQRRGGWEIVVAGPDRPGLLSDLAAVLAAEGVNIDAAYISSAGPLIIDTFVVRGGESAVLDHEGRRRRVQRSLGEAMGGSVDVSDKLRERRRAEAVLASGAPQPSTRVVYDLDVEAQATVLDVFAPDRVGLLHEIARALFAAGVSISLARISTEGHRAVDSFYVVEASTGEALSEARREEVRQALLAALGAT